MVMARYCIAATDCYSTVEKKNFSRLEANRKQITELKKPYQ